MRPAWMIQEKTITGGEYQEDTSFVSSTRELEPAQGKLGYAHGIERLHMPSISLNIYPVICKVVPLV